MNDSQSGSEISRKKSFIFLDISYIIDYLYLLVNFNMNEIK